MNRPERQLVCLGVTLSLNGLWMDKRFLPRFKWMDICALGTSGNINSHRDPLCQTFRPVVFIGPFEHHSNILPWRESCADVVQIAENDVGGVDLADLKSKLKDYSSRHLKIGMPETSFRSILSRV